jgi:DNA polymerase-3 subunit delta'
VSDIFDSVVGQNAAVAAMREHVRHPVHAYLISGPSGANVEAAAQAFVAALQCPEHGCGLCDVCRRVLSGQEADVHVAQRAGASWSVDDIHDLERISRRRPLRAPYNIVVLEDVELTLGATPSAPALLKTLEEPATKTIFVLTAEELPEELITVMSRCVSIPLQGLSIEGITEVLVRDGAAPAAAREAAMAASGNLRRAQVLVNDPSLAVRLELWRTAPKRFNGTASSASAIALEISAAITEALAPLVSLQDAELETMAKQAKDMGLRGVPGRAKLEQQHKREQRRFRLDELRFGLSVLTSVYRERMLELASLEEPDQKQRYALSQSMHAIELVAETSNRLRTTIDEGLLLHDLMLSLMRL